MVAKAVPPPPGGTDNKPGWAADPKAKAEADNWDNEEKLRGVRLANDILWTKLYGWIVAGMMIFFSLAFCFSLIVWVAHYTTPWGWLSSDQLSKIQSVIFSGSLGAIVTAYAQKHINRL